MWLHFNNLIEKKTAFRGRRVSNKILLGLTGVILVYGSVAGIVSLTYPPSPSGDNANHLDYAWRLSKGEIPTRMEGITYPPFLEITGYRQQQAAAHPPLFYILHAPVVSSLMDQGQWVRATISGRGLNVVLGILAIFALSWAGWVFGGRNKELFAVSVPALSVLMYRFTRLNLDYALDALLVIFSTLSLIFAYKILIEGPKREYLTTLTLVSVLGMATKAPYIVFLFLSAMSVFVSYIINFKKKNFLRNFAKGFMMSSAIVLTVLFAIGWFYYYWNYSIGGSWFTARPPEFTGGRTPQTLGDVLTNVRLWRLFYGDYSRYLAMSVSIISFATAGFLTIKKRPAWNYLKTKRGLFAICLLLFSVAGVFATQIEHAVGVGSINFRYMLPAVVTFGLYLSFGLTQFKSMRAQLVTFAVAGMALSTLYARSSGNFSHLYLDASNIGIPGVAITILLFLCIVGLLALSVSLFKISSNKPA